MIKQILGLQIIQAVLIDSHGGSSLVQNASKLRQTAYRGFKQLEQKSNDGSSDNLRDWLVGISVVLVFGCLCYSIYVFLYTQKQNEELEDEDNQQTISGSKDNISIKDITQSDSLSHILNDKSTDLNGKSPTKDQTYLGTVWINISYLAMSISIMLMKIIFIRVPEIDSAQFLFIREFAQFAILMVVVNRHLKYYLYDIVSRDDFANLIYRSCFGTSNTYFFMQITRYFPIVIVGICSNLAPATTCIISAIFIKERIKSIDALILVTSFIGVMFIIRGTTSKQGLISNIPWWAYLGLAMVPLGFGGSNVMYRHMNNTHFVTMAMYKYIILFPALVFALWYQDKLNLDILQKFNVGDWALLLGSSIMCQLGPTARFLAFKYDQPVNIIHYSYLVTVYTLFFNILLFPFNFNNYEIIGLAIMICGYSIKFTHAAYNVKKRLKEQADDESSWTNDSECSKSLINDKV